MVIRSWSTSNLMKYGTEIITNDERIYMKQLMADMLEVATLSNPGAAHFMVDIQTLINENGMAYEKLYN